MVNVSVLEKFFESGDEVTPELLRDRGVIRKNDLPVKVLANGELSKKLTVKVAKFSKTAKEKIEAAGGQCVVE